MFVRYIKRSSLWADEAENMEVDDYEPTLARMFYFKISAKLYSNKDVIVVDEWTHEHHIEFDKLINDNTNEQEIKSMLNQANVPTETYVLREFLDDAIEMALNTKKRVIGMHVEVGIIDHQVDDDMDDDDDNKSLEDIDHMEDELITSIMFYFKLIFTKNALDLWTKEFCVEWDKSMDDNTNKENIKVMLLEANLPSTNVDEDDVTKVLEYACREAHDESNKNKRRLSKSIRVVIPDDDDDDDDDDYDDEYESFDMDIEHDIQTKMVPASKEMIDNLEAVKINEENSIQCSVCFEDLLIGSEATSMPCSHTFHSDCITQWLHKNNSCPLCRSELTIS
ncbi:hypothetical protein ACFE04_004869 [Oxalis oulophora]